MTADEHQKLLSDIQGKFRSLSSSHPYLRKKAVFGVMPDWNPAEIIFDLDLWRYLFIKN